MVRRIKLIACGLGLSLGLGLASPFMVAQAQSLLDSTLMVLGDFESGSLTGWYKVRVNLPTVTTERARAGRYSLKSVLRADAPTVYERERTESMALGSYATIGKDHWYGFSVFLPSDYVADKVWELVAQWHVDPDDAVEQAALRNPALALESANGVWRISNASDPRAQTPGRDGVTNRSFQLGAYETNKWTDWVFHIKWSYLSDGVLQVWKDGKLVVNATGPNCYNDNKGPYFKMGIYKGWGSMASDQVTVRTIYHDEFRMAGPTGSYEAVAPGGGEKRPNPPTTLTIH